jgi:hypothetical protein
MRNRDHAPRARLQREVRIGLAANRALHLFTPAGERLWVEDWEPTFPAGESGDGAGEGTVFVTDHGGHRTIWTVVERGERHVRYARTTPDHWAGVVEVRCHPDAGEATRAIVTYELTALSEDGRRALDEFARGYPQYVAEWERLIAAAVTISRDRGSGPAG